MSGEADTTRYQLPIQAAEEAAVREVNRSFPQPPPTLAQRLHIDQHDSSFGACIRERIEAADVIERLERELTEAQSECAIWKGEVADLIGMNNALRAQLVAAKDQTK